MFGELKEIFWISKISLSTEREQNIVACFQKHITFKYLQNLDDFNTELTLFQRKRDNDNCNENFVMGEHNIFNKLIVIDNLSALANKSDNFANFLTFSQKFNFTCVYVFHTIYVTRANWQIILSQTKKFNTFPGSLQRSSVTKILSSYCNRYTYEYIPPRDIWINCLYSEISNSSKKQCLTINMRHVNDLGPSKFRTGAENDKEQICYYNYNKKDRAFNLFLAVRKQTLTDAAFFFIVNLIDKSNKYKDSYFKISNELTEFNDTTIQPKPRIREPSEGNTDRRTTTNKQQQQQNNRRR